MQNEYRVAYRSFKTGAETWKTFGNMRDAVKLYDRQISKFGETLSMLYLREYTDDGMRTLRFMAEGE